MKVVQRMLRRRQVMTGSQTSLRRCLGVCELVMMGLGSMVGSGIYIMTGMAAKQQAGPGIVLSFVAAALVIIPIMLCFTELAASFHRTGSTYLYLYLTLGELPAFLQGYSGLILILLGGATNARAWSAYLDSLFGRAIVNMTQTYVAHWDIGAPIAPSPDLLAVGVLVVATVVVASGASFSTRFMGVFSLVNILILIFTSVVGFYYADLNNWTSKETGSFLPFGWMGLISGSAACFWAFSGFEIISMAVEEARDVRRDIPLASGLVLFIVTVLYVSTASSLTLMTSYTRLDMEAPLPSAFAERGLKWAQYVVSIGPLCGLTTSIFMSLYSFARMAYAIADDGLLYGVFAHVSLCSQVPVFGTFFAGLFMMVVAFFLDLSELITFSVNLTLINYALVCICVIVLRFRNTVTNAESQLSVSVNDPTKLTVGRSDEAVPGELKARYSWLQSVLWCRGWTTKALCVSVVCMLSVGGIVKFGAAQLAQGQWTVCLVLALLLVICVATIVSLTTFHQNTEHLPVKIPCVPILPSTAMFCCLVLLVFNSSLSGWIATAVLLLLGLLIYFTYGMHHSKLEGVLDKQYLLQSMECDSTKHRLLSSDSSDDMMD